MEQYAAIEKIDELAVYWGGTVAKINGSSMGESAKRSVRHVNAVWERREKEHVFTLRLADAHKHLRILYCTRSPRRALLRAGKQVTAAEQLKQRSLLACCSLCFLNHLHALPHQNFTETRTKQNKQKPLGFSLFLWESLFLGTPSGELIVNLITQGLGFPWKGCFSRKERDSPHPNGTHTSSDAPLLPFHPLLLSFYVTQPFFLKVPLVFFKESTPNKNLCHFPPKPSRLKNKTKQ